MLGREILLRFSMAALLEDLRKVLFFFIFMFVHCFFPALMMVVLEILKPRIA